MGVRITELPSQPSMTSADKFVIDGQEGTRNVSLQNSLVMSGTIRPSNDVGVEGSIYVQYYEPFHRVKCVYFKTDTGWVPSPSPYIPQE